MAHSAIPIACSASHSAQNIALNELGRQAIMADPNWKKENSTPDKGHDSFLLDVPEFLKTINEFLNSTYNEINNEKRI